ncbi:MAG: family 43 glycosylhydrolase [Solobacterium sp.]|nr:family 43 glycosylhydrolase [Solobacterium sp.]
MNPLFGFDEYIPDGEPHLFEGRLYLFGSQDEMHGEKYSPCDYTAWSCDPADPEHWRCEGTIYRKNQDPRNPDGRLSLFAPDVVQGYDGYYYLYYELETVEAVSVARSRKPAGPYEYYGTVQYPEGVSPDALPDYPYPFDPGLFREDGHIYMALGFSVDFAIKDMDLNERNMRGAYIVELEKDMLTMKHVPVFAVPGCGHGKGTSFEGHEFLEASSLRKYNGQYCFIYSSQAQHELCYATADSIYGPYTYQGVLVSNAWENGLRNNWANNHGSLVEINGRYAVFYHRHTCGIQYSRQACAEWIRQEDGRFITAEITCQGLSGNPLGNGIYPAGMACFVRDGKEGTFIPFGGVPMNAARIEGTAVVNITESTLVYRYFAAVKSVVLYLEGEVSGSVELYLNGRKTDSRVLSSRTELQGEGENTDVELVFHSPSPVCLAYIEIKG